MDNQPKQPLVLTGGRVVIALVLTAGLAASLTALDYGLRLYLSPQWFAIKPYALLNITYYYGGAFLVRLIGLALCGGPVWHVMHLFGLRKWHHAMLAGFCVPFLVLLTLGTGFFTGLKSGNWSYSVNGVQHWVDGQITAMGWLAAFQLSAIFGGIGAVLGLVIWHTAYRRG